MNNGFTTGPFSLGRGVRQGDPLSPYLFILALETLAIKIRQDHSSVQGLQIGEEIIKLSLFADDMTCVIKTKCVSNIELHTAREKNKLLFHLQKWEKLINGFDNY